MKQLAAEHAVHLFGVFHRAHAVALLAEEALKQTTQTGIVIDDENFFAFDDGNFRFRGHNGSFHD